MRYDVVVRVLETWYSYGSFETRLEACKWAEMVLGGYDWHVAQRVEV